MSQDSAQERTHEPTAKRIQDSRKKGQVARSRDLNTFLVLIGAGLAGLALGPGLINSLAQLLKHNLGFDPRAPYDAEHVLNASYMAMEFSMISMLPLLLLLFFFSLLGPLFLGGWLISGDAVKPKLERVDPVKGLQRIFSLNSLVELFKSICKFLLVTATAGLVLWQILDWLVALSAMPLRVALPEAGERIVVCFLYVSSVLLLIVLFDVPFQIWEHRRKLRMTLVEVKDELKELEGRPEVKGHIRNLQQEAAKQRMLSDVADADVVITNPTHYAVVLKYAPDESDAPRVVAKGKDLLAAQIRKIATDSGVAIFSAPPLARALYAQASLGQPIPVHMFAAVARILAYIYQLRRLGNERAPAPPDPSTLLPDQLEQGVRHD